MQNQNEFAGLFVKQPQFYRLFFSMTFAIALQNVIILAVNLADNIMLGQFSEPALSGAALVNQIQYFLQMLVMGVGEGILILIARHWGQGDKAAVCRLTCLGIKIGLLFTLMLTFLSMAFPHNILSLFSSDPTVLAEGGKYLVIACISYPFFCITNILICALRGVETVKIGFLISLSTLAVKLLLNYALIFGNLGAPRLGIVGAAVSTTIARVIEAVIAVCYVLLADSKINLRLKGFVQTDWVLLKEYVHTGSPVLMSNTAWGIAQAVQTAILGHMGATAIAANSIASTIYQILMVVGFGAGSASAVLIAKTVGEGQSGRAEQYAKTLQLLFLLIGLLTGAALFLCRSSIVGLYQISPEAHNMALNFIAVLAVVAVGSSYQAPTLAGIVRGGGDTKFTFINDTAFMWLLVIPLSAVGAFILNLPPLAIFISLKLDQLLKCIVAYIKVNHGQWIRA